MAATPEGKVKDAVRKLLTEHGVYHFMPAANGFGRAGIPDIICCHQGKFIGIECKAGKGKTTALQDRELWAIRAAGGTAMVINEDCLIELKEKLQWMR
jgi:Holliday junction resolvase